MQLEITSRHIDVPDRLKDRIREKLVRLERHAGPIHEARLVFTADKRGVVAEAVVSGRRTVWKARADDGEAGAAAAAALDRIAAQADRYRARAKAKKGRSSARRIPEAEPRWEGTASESGRVRIVRARPTRIKPMSAEDAAIELEGSGREVVVFRDSGTEKVSVLFRRRDGVFGLVSPEW